MNSLESYTLKTVGVTLYTDDIDSFVLKALSAPAVVDIETDEKDNFVGLGICQNAEEVFYFTSLNPRLMEFLKVTPLIGHNLKADLHWLKLFGIVIKTENIFYDTMLASYVLNPARESQGLKPLAKELLGFVYPTYRDIVGKGRNKVTLDRQPVELVANYCGSDALATFKLYQHFRFTTDEQRVFDLEMEVMRLLYAMEERGVTVDVPYLRELGMTFSAEIKELQAKVEDMAGHSLNLNSPQQMVEFLYNQLGLTTVSKRTKRKDRKTGKVYWVEGPTTDKAALQELDGMHEVIPHVARFRELSKLNSTYVNGILKLPTLPKVHTTFNQVAVNEAQDDWAGIRTGRLCVHPETLVEMPRDLKKFPSGVPLSLIKQGDLVYSLTPDKKLCLKKVLWCGPTKSKECIKITVQNKWGVATSVILSKDHLVRIWGGSWKHAEALKIGDKLCGFPRRGIGEYASFFPSSLRRKKGESGGKAKEHRWVYAQVQGWKGIPSYMEIHHKDGNKLNNTSSNLVHLSALDHRKLHNCIPKQEVQKGLEEPRLWKHHPRTLKRLAKKFGLVATNHTIIQIEGAGVQDLWDMEVEDTHTFFGGEIALHNSSSGPNLHSIPTRTETGNLLRKAFVAGETGAVILCFDYSQIEYRLLAHFTKEPVLLQAFRTGKDVHEETGRMFGVERYIGKTLNFAAIYGAQAKKMALTAKITRERAQELLDQYWSKLPYVKSWIGITKLIAAKRGYVTTLMGRRIPILNIRSGDRLERWKAERQAVNYVIQGSAADIIKLAMVECWKQGLLPILQVHDELLFEVPVESASETERKVRGIMESVMPLYVPLNVDSGFGASWAEAKVH